jgi:hypothetical protein
MFESFFCWYATNGLCFLIYSWLSTGGFYGLITIGNFYFYFAGELRGLGSLLDLCMSTFWTFTSFLSVWYGRMDLFDCYSSCPSTVNCAWLTSSRLRMVSALALTLRNTYSVRFDIVNFETRFRFYPRIILLTKSSWLLAKSHASSGIPLGFYAATLSTDMLRRCNLGFRRLCRLRIKSSRDGWLRENIVKSPQYFKKGFTCWSCGSLSNVSEKFLVRVSMLVRQNILHTVPILSMLEALWRRVWVNTTIKMMK